MKREILFRGKSKESGEWVYGTGFTDFLNIFPKNRGRVWLRCDYKYYDGLGKDWIEILPDSIGQFTGLTDKNGKRVFEGDILADGAIVEWFDELFWDGGGSTHPGFYCEKWASCGELSWHERLDDKCEIIGNVFDNPELVAK
jgi:hypothetical protein